MHSSDIHVARATPMISYEDFLRRKIAKAEDSGHEVPLASLNPKLFPHQRDIAQWAIRGGNRAIFASFGLGKTLIQIQILETLLAANPADTGLIICPLGVKGEFVRDARAFFTEEIIYVRTDDEFHDLHKIGQRFFLTNYERIRDGSLDPNHFTVVSLDEASVLRGFGGTKTFREFMRLFELNPNIKHKFVATATPSPNDYIELLAYAAFLDVMDVGQAKTRFFKRDSTKADVLTLHPHKEREFWLWVSTWAVFINKPSDLGYSDEGYELPEMRVHWHELRTDHAGAGEERNGQGKLLRNSAVGIQDAAKEKRRSLPQRIAKAKELIDKNALYDFANCDSHWLIWHDLEDERRAIEKEIPLATTIFGQQDLELREQIVADFSDGKIAILGSKPVLTGSGCNFQRFCHRAIFLGIGFKFNDFIQSVHRIQRFLQKYPVELHLIYTEAEREVRRVLEAKWEKHNELVAQMTAIIRQYGLAKNALHSEMTRAFGVERVESKGENFLLVNNDAVFETRSMEADSVHLILTSIPFSTQYEYTPSYNDFGHSDSNELFFEQMDYLTPELLRILQPGRVCAIHVKDRIVPGGMTGLGFQTVYPFHAVAIAHYQKHGFAYLGMKTIVTDVVRENNQTYRLGWTEQCKDGSRMGVGMPEYLLLFRKPPTDQSNGYADVTVVKSKAEYSRSRWQIDAHGFARSSGNRLLTTADLAGIPHEKIFKLFRQFSREHVYGYEHHVGLSESLETCQDCGHIHLKSAYCAQWLKPEWIKCPRCEGSCSVPAEEGGGKPCPDCLADGTLNQGWVKTHSQCECRGAGRLPVTFMLLQPQSWSEEVYTDITRMLSLNAAQSASGREMHLCPLQFDLADRVITQFTMPGETVYDPFGGLGTVAFRAVKLKRRGIAVELSSSYFKDAVYYCNAAEKEVESPSLFDLVEEPA
jgi:DNA modification methylase